MNVTSIRLTIIALLSVTGIFHLGVALLNIAPGLGLPLAAFGIIYSTLGYFVRKDTKDGSKSHSRNAILAAMAACTLGLALGGSNYLSNGGPIALPIMFAIDIAIIAFGLMWLSKQKKPS